MKKNSRKKQRGKRYRKERWLKVKMEGEVSNIKR